MCFYFRSWNSCPDCLVTFNKRRNRVPCWNGSLASWKVHRHGLVCGSDVYERSEDEVYGDRLCWWCIDDEKKEKAKNGKKEARRKTKLGKLGNSVTIVVSKRASAAVGALAARSRVWNCVVARRAAMEARRRERQSGIGEGSRGRDCTEHVVADGSDGHQTALVLHPNTPIHRHDIGPSLIQV